MRVGWLVAGIGLALLLTACDSTSFTTDPDAANPAFFSATTPEPGSSTRDSSGWGDVKLVRTATMELEVSSFDTARLEIENATKAVGGLVVQLSMGRDEQYGVSAQITLRVPSTRLDELLPQLRRLGKVKHDDVTSQDVSKQYSDLQTRLEVKHRTERRLQALLDSHAGKLSDVLEVERELDRVVGEIEQMLGEKRLYDHQIEFSRVSLSLREPGTIRKPRGFDPIRNAFRNSLQALATSAAGIVYAAAVALPWMVVAGLVWFVVSRVRRSRKAG